MWAEKEKENKWKKKVKSLLECFFHNGNINPQDKMNV